MKLSSSFQLGYLCLAAAALVGIRTDGVLAQQTRDFAPGVVTTIPPNFEPAETVSTHDLVEIRANADARWKPEYLPESRTLYGMSRGREVPPRRVVSGVRVQAAADGRSRPSQAPAARLERKLVWYLVYSVRNTGEVMQSVEQKDGVYQPDDGQGRAAAIRPELRARIARPDRRRPADRQSRISIA